MHWARDSLSMSLAFCWGCEKGNWWFNMGDILTARRTADVWESRVSDLEWASSASCMLAERLFMFGSIPCSTTLPLLRPTCNILALRALQKLETTSVFIGMTYDIWWLARSRKVLKYSAADWLPFEFSKRALVSIKNVSQPKLHWDLHAPGCRYDYLLYITLPQYNAFYPSVHIIQMSCICISAISCQTDWWSTAKKTSFIMCPLVTDFTCCFVLFCFIIKFSGTRTYVFYLFFLVCLPFVVSEVKWIKSQ